MLKHLTMVPLILGTGCNPGHAPGVEVGTFRVVTTLIDDTCGVDELPGDEAFVVELRRISGRDALWVLEGEPGVAGTLDDDGNFVFDRESSFVVSEPVAFDHALEEPADYLNGAALDPQPTVGCALTIRERVQGILLSEPDSDASMSQSELRAESTLSLAPTAGSDCRSALAIVGGPYHELPCAVSYELLGAPPGP